MHEQEIGQADMVTSIANNQSCGWLLRFEALEIALNNGMGNNVVDTLKNQLLEQTGNSAVLIEGGLRRLKLAS